MNGLLDPKLDYIFKNIFGTEENKPLLISFLNALLFEGKPHIKDLSLQNPNIEKILELDKASRLDVVAITNDNSIVNIEIQLRNTGDIPHRAFYYLSNIASRSIKEGESYKKVSVIGIWILGENVTKRQNAISDAYMTFQPSDPDPYQVMTDCARIMFIELQKFNPKKSDSKNLLTAWLSFLKDPIFMDESFLQVKEVKQAMDRLKYISADDEIRSIADLRQKTINDKNSEITIAKEEGLAEGIVKGLLEGEAKKARETALKLLSRNMDVKDISDITGLTAEEISDLKR